MIYRSSKNMVAQAAIYAAPRFHVYNTVFTLKTFVLNLLSLLMYIIFNIHF